MSFLQFWFISYNVFAAPILKGNSFCPDHPRFIDLVTAIGQDEQQKPRSFLKYQNTVEIVYNAMK